MNCKEDAMNKPTVDKTDDLRRRQGAPLATPNDLEQGATADIAGALNAILADVFAIYLKTKNFHWHMSGPHFRDYHLMLDEHADELYAMTDPIAERIRKLGGATLRSIGHIARIQRVLDNDAGYVKPLDMLSELREDNKTLAVRLREAHDLCDGHRGIASASLIGVWIDEPERRTWFLFEASRRRDSLATNANRQCRRSVRAQPPIRFPRYFVSSNRSIDACQRLEIPSKRSPSART
jgi:starvation-inducible DNA-binding protein